MKKPNEQQIQLLKLDDLTPHHGYQRSANRQHIGRIIAVFDESLVGVLMVSPREKGGYFIWDGNHRLEVLKALGYTHWHCMVSVITPVEQSMSFQTINDNVLRVSPIQKHTAALFRDEPEALELEDALYKAGCHVGTSGNGHVAAVTACYTVLRKYGANNLTDTLKVLEIAWGREDKTSRSAALIGGISRTVDGFHLQRIIGGTSVSRETIGKAIAKDHATGGTFTGAAQAKFAASGGSKGHNQYKYANMQVNKAIKAKK